MQIANIRFIAMFHKLKLILLSYVTRCNYARQQLEGLGDELTVGNRCQKELFFVSSGRDRMVISYKDLGSLWIALIFIVMLVLHARFILVFKHI